jgi:hypothetical protein
MGGISIGQLEDLNALFCRTTKLSQPEIEPRKRTALGKNMMRKRLGSSALLGSVSFFRNTLAMRNRLRMVEDVTNNAP